jgi:hypothetical protein
MHDWPARGREWSLDQKLNAIKVAGFDGVCAYLTPELKAGADRRGLVLMSGFDCSDLALARPRLEAQRELGAHFINIQLLNHDTPPPKAAAMAVKLIKLSRSLGLGVHIETHRDTSTETPEKFTEIARLYRKATSEIMPVTWDHSHFAVSKHVMPKDYSARLLTWPESIQHSQMFHLRPFNSQHCQIPVTDGRGHATPEFKDYLNFVEDLFTLWLSGPRPGDALWTCPELGCTHGYHVSTNPHPWPDAIAARTAFASAWKRALKRAEAPSRSTV